MFGLPDEAHRFEVPVCVEGSNLYLGDEPVHRFRRSALACCCAHPSDLYDGMCIS